MRYIELERLVCAGAVSHEFRQMLLADPVQAASVGYCGQPFHLSQEELDFIVAIRAVDFQQFAEQVGLWIAQHRNGHNGNGTGNKEDPLRLPVYGRAQQKPWGA